MPKRRDRVILDTNLLISFLLTKDFSRLDIILDLRQITLIFNEELLNEFIEVAKRPKFKKYFNSIDLQQLLLRIASRAEFIEVNSIVNVCRDPKDNYLLALARDGKATHLITGDKDLLVLSKFGKTKIVSMTRYLSRK